MRFRGCAVPGVPRSWGLPDVYTGVYNHPVGKQRGIRDFIWDDANEEHLARHGVTPEEVEEIFAGRISVRRSRQGRYLVLGRSGTGRYLAGVIEKLGAGRVRVVTARDMSPAERRRYARRK